MTDFLARTDYTNRERLLPSQPAMRQHFGGTGQFEINTPFFELYLELTTNSVLPVNSVHEKFDIQLKPGMTYETLGSDLSTLHFLQLLVRLTGARHVLEIGTYIGVSTMFLAEAVGPAGFIYTIEKGSEFIKLASENLIRNALYSRVQIIPGDALDVVQKRFTGDLFGMIFLDGAKEEYGNLLEPLLAVLRPGGLLVADDVFCNGDLFNVEPTTEKGRGVRDMLAHVATLKDHSPVILPYGDGLLLLRKPEDK